ncbi:MAG: DUF3035 domain-containing protein [Rhodospirillaceae bacterium]
MIRYTLNLCGAIACAAVLAGGLTGCESVKKSFGGGKNAPDEFVVYKRPPLSLPPEYGLRPPNPGQAQLQTTSPTDEAREAILGAQKTSQQPAAQPQPAAPSSPGLQALMSRTGATAADPNIRRLVDQESSVLAEEDQPFANKLIFWVDEKPDPGTVVDAKKEQQRIMSNQALGKPINEGEVPQVKRKSERKGLLEF